MLMDKGGSFLAKRPRMVYSALILTGVNLLLRTAGTSFQVYISGKIGAAGVGLLQLVLSVGSFAMIAGMAGIRTSTMYLCAEELGKKQPATVAHVLSGCILYSILCSCTAAIVLYTFSPSIAQFWIKDIRILSCLRLYAAFLPIVCLTGVLSGYFTAAGRIGTLAAVEVAEQILSMLVTVYLLKYWSGTDSARACLCVILGSSCGTCLTLICLFFLCIRTLSKKRVHTLVRSRLIHTAIPLAAADVLKSGINTVENLMVPRRLEMHVGTIVPLAAFGLVTGMVFPVIMYPACILFALAELLIPEMARCNASANKKRILYLTGRSLKITLCYGLLFSGWIFLCAENLCLKLYGNTEAVISLRLYSLLIPMLYCDILIDAMTKGLGQQKICVLYNIITSFLDVVLLFILLPKYGMNGYFISFTITHALNFILSLQRLMKISGYPVPGYVPMLAVSAALLSGVPASLISSVPIRLASFTVILGCILYLFGLIHREDLHWIINLVFPFPGSKKSRRNQCSDAI